MENKAKKRKRVYRSIALFLGLLSWYSVVQISISNLIKDTFVNYIISAILVLIGVVLISYSITPID